mgnify:CR=1 FL=1
MATTKSKEKRPSFDKEDLKFEFNYQNSGNDIHCDLGHCGFIRICCRRHRVRRLVARRGGGCSDGINVPVVGPNINGCEGTRQCRHKVS